MAIAALTQILNWGVENIQAALSSFTQQVSLLAHERGLPVSDNNHVGHIIGLFFEDSKVANLNKYLLSDNIFVSFRRMTIRIAPHLHNEISDIEKLFEVIRNNMN